MKSLISLKTLLALLLCTSLSAQNEDGFALEMFGAGSSPINSFGSAYDYNGVKAWTELPFEAGAGFSFRKSAGKKNQWGLKITASRMAFAYVETDYLDGNGITQSYRPVSTRRIYINMEPVFAFRLIEGSGFNLDLENSIGIKLPLNAYSLGRDAGGNNVDLNDFDRFSYGALTVFKAQIAPCIVWPSTRLSVFGAYQVSSGNNWEALSGWSTGVQISYFIEE